jgi:hypothetical protein
MVSEPSIVKAIRSDLGPEELHLMQIGTSGCLAALVLSAAAFAGPAAAQLKGVGGVGAPHSAGGGAGMAAHPSFGGGAGIGARPSFGGGAGMAAHQNFGGGGFAARNPSAAAPLMTGRSVAAPNAGLAAAGAGPKAGFATRPGFTPNPSVRGAFHGGGHHRVWPYAAAAAGAGIAYGVGTYGYDYPYDTGYYDSGYDAVPIAPAATDMDEGGSCATPALVCRLYEPAPIGYGCSCSVGGGQARGVVQP